jgi:ligand-binding sensor domain-containing protein
MTNTEVEALTLSGRNLFAGTYGGVYRSTDNGTSWKVVNANLTHANTYALLVKPANGNQEMNLFAGTGASGIFRSTDNGTSWMSSSTGLANIEVRSFAMIDSTLFSGTGLASVPAGVPHRVGVFRSPNNGTNWTATNAGLTDTSIISALVARDTNLFAGTDGGFVFRSTNKGTNWTKTGLNSHFIRALAVRGSNLFAGSYSDGVFLSTNNGLDWNAANNGLSFNYINALEAKDALLFSGTWRHGAFRTADDGRSWTAAGLTDLDVTSFATSGAKLFAGTSGNGVFLSINDGASWTAVNTGLADSCVWALAVSDTNLFAGTNTGVWRRPLLELVVSVGQTRGSEVPYEYSLGQNYPNPFNPSTKIQFTIVNRQLTIVKVFDLLGREVATLVNEVKEPGTYTVQFDGSNLASGVYFYRLQAGDFVETKKLMILK